MTRGLRIVGLLGAIALAITLGCSAYRSGLFFDSDFYWLELSIITCAVLAGIAGCWSFVPWRVKPWSLAPFAIAAVYALVYMLQPASTKGTADAFLRWTAYASWMVLLGILMADSLRRKAAWAGLQAVGAFLVIGGWLGWFDWLRFPEIIFRSNEAALAANGARLAGFLQYPNAFGAVVAAFALMQWQLIASERRTESLASSLLLVPTLGALFLTESRGALLALAIGFVIAAALRKPEQRGSGFAAAGIAAALAAAAASKAFEAMKQGRPGDGMWALIAATLVGGGLLFVIRNSGLYSGRRRWGARCAKAVKVAASTPGGLFLLVMGMFAAYLLLAGGGTAGARVVGHFETAAARQMYYADALRMFRDHPWLGTGGESWRMLVGLYQSEPYIGNEVHSGYLEMLIDTGLLGIVLLLGMLAWYACKLRRGAPGVWGPAAVLLSHAAIDFDWSYGFAWLLLFYWLALHLSAREQEPAPGAGVYAAAQPGPRRPRTAWPPRLAAPLCAALLLGFAAAALPAAWRSAAAASEQDAALAAAAPGARAAHLRAALEADPSWTTVRLQLAALLPMQERASLLAAGLRYEPQSAPLELELGATYAELGQPALARDHLREGLRLGRYDREAQNAAIARMATLADRLAYAGRGDEARTAAAAAVEFFESYRELYRQTYAGQANPWEDKKLALFVSAKTNAARAMALLGRTEEARSLLLEVMQENSPEWSQEAAERLKRLEEAEG
ncbi:O-antigen ligase family protein [Cohnella lubricantis]|uniref:O-antigen ligase family protein n=1 Tax=Cohnella lubricantis TaxID=2163172 RepID=A0A841TG94_9BACL|nr:O-antigen ligase family protein [Cohnella lubricantis]MBB6677967.1 O-antigen ligase family protein [Cohnella lubricantis]MBP2119965.1 tetratricopeptide (TPR) repeat protein [Cohnella lubricantis]